MWINVARLHKTSWEMCEKVWFCAQDKKLVSMTRLKETTLIIINVLFYVFIMFYNKNVNKMVNITPTQQTQYVTNL